MRKHYYEEGAIALVGIDKDEYVQNMYNYYNDDEVTHYMVYGLRPGNVEKLEDEYNSIVKGENVVFSILEKKNDKVIGFTGLYSINWQTRHAEFRIIIGDKSSHGRGLGTVITKYLVSYAFEKLNLNKVWLGVNAENSAAVKCYEKAGFVKEGTLRQENFRNNQYYDIVRMSILRSEYAK
jgi:RimJ/RimL family protein N-acetyltransferase